MADHELLRLKIAPLMRTCISAPRVDQRTGLAVSSKMVAGMGEMFVEARDAVENGCQNTESDY